MTVKTLLNRRLNTLIDNSVGVGIKAFIATVALSAILVGTAFGAFFIGVTIVFAAVHYGGVLGGIVAVLAIIGLAGWWLTS